MSFGTSAYLNWLRGPAPQEQVKEQLRRLLSLIGKEDSPIVDVLTNEPIKQEQLVELVKWNERLKPSPRRDRIAHQAVRFWVAQTLVSTLMRGRSLKESFDYGADANEIMELGADGIYEFGNSQFAALRALSDDVLQWLHKKGVQRLALIESPLGNSLPVQVIKDRLDANEIDVEVVVWNSPRNDRPWRGATIGDAAEACAAAIQNHDMIIFPDDVSTGTRFLKIYDALSKHVQAERSLFIALAVNDSTKPENKDHPNRQRLLRRLSDHAQTLDFESPWIDMPYLRLFRLDDGNHCRWQNALVWEDSDLMAGKRKVNLLFTLLDHMFEILDDLGSAESFYRSYLDLAWRQNTDGQHFVFAPGLVHSVFTGIKNALKLDVLRAELEKLGESRFPSDYVGEYLGRDDELLFVKERWDWLGKTYIDLSTSKIGEQKAWMSWSAVDHVFAGSLKDKTPRPNRDQSATPYVIPFNATIRKFNERLRWRILNG